MKLRDAEDDIKQQKTHLLMMTDTANEYKIYTNIALTPWPRQVFSIIITLELPKKQNKQNINSFTVTTKCSVILFSSFENVLRKYQIIQYYIKTNTLNKIAQRRPRK